MFKSLGQALRQHIGLPLWRLGAKLIPDQPRRKRSWFYFRKGIALWLGRDKTTVWLTCDAPDIHGNQPLQVKGPTVFRGWALSMRGIASVSFFCDGVFLGEARRGMPRPDVVALAAHLQQSSRCGFHYLLDPRSLPAGMHQLTIKAKSYDGTSAETTCRMEVLYSPDDYAVWRRKRAATPGTLTWMKRHVGCLLDQPCVALTMKLSADAEPMSLPATIRSLQEQVYASWKLYITCDKPAFEKHEETLGRLTALESRVDVHVEPLDDRARIDNIQTRSVSEDLADASGLCPGIAHSDKRGEVWGRIDAGDILEPNALFEVVYALNRETQIDFVYTDEDSIVGPGVRDFPVLKADWSGETLAGAGSGPLKNRVGRLWLARRQLVLESAGHNAGHDLLEESELVLKLMRNARKICHVKSVLYSRLRRWDKEGPAAPIPKSAHYSASTETGHAVASAPVPMLEMANIKKILVVMLDHLGDVLLAFPAIERLAQLFPRARITALVGKWSASLVRGNQWIDEVLTYDFFDASSSEPHRRIDEAEAARIENWLSARGFDLAVDFRREPETRDFLRLSRARHTVGFSQGKEAEWLTVALPYEPNIQWVRPRRHVAQELVHLVEMIGVAGRSNIRPRVTVLPSAEQSATKEMIILAFPDDERLRVAIHPGSGRSIKCWPAEHFAGLADMLVERLQARIVWLGSGNEISLVEAIVDRMQCRDASISLAGRLTIPQLLATLEHFELFIGNDSGPTHLAAGAGLPTLCICSGTIDPVQWAPIGPAALVVHRLMTCSPCYLRDRQECPFDVACLSGLSVEAVWEAVVRTLLPQWDRLSHTPEFAAHAKAPRGRRDDALRTSDPGDVAARLSSNS